MLLEMLARRAAEQLPFRTLRRASPDPWADIGAERFEDLAAIELDRLGVPRHSPERSAP